MLNATTVFPHSFVAITISKAHFLPRFLSSLFQPSAWIRGSRSPYVSERGNSLGVNEQEPEVASIVTVGFWGLVMVFTELGVSGRGFMARE